MIESGLLCPSVELPFLPKVYWVGAVGLSYARLLTLATTSAGVSWRIIGFCRLVCFELPSWVSAFGLLYADVLLTVSVASVGVCECGWLMWKCCVGDRLSSCVCVKYST